MTCRCESYVKPERISTQMTILREENITEQLTYYLLNKLTTNLLIPFLIKYKKTGIPLALSFWNRIKPITS